MSSPLPLASPDDSDLDQAVATGLSLCRIDPEWARTVRDLATGALPAATLQCCGSDCRPCVLDILRCTQVTLETLRDSRSGDSGDPDAGTAGQPGPHLRGPRRGLASELLWRIRRRLGR